jgi:hypothetical protein
LHRRLLESTFGCCGHQRVCENPVLNSVPRLRRSHGRPGQAGSFGLIPQPLPGWADVWRPALQAPTKTQSLVCSDFASGVLTHKPLHPLPWRIGQRKEPRGQRACVRTVRLLGSFPVTDHGCPTSRSFFARCGIPQLPTYSFQPASGYRSRSVVSHISQKTSEIWGTRDSWQLQSLDRRFSHTLFSP